MANEQNLRPPWKPGQSGNPAGHGPGRPRKGVITDEAMSFLQENHPKHEGKTRARVIAEKWVRRAENDMQEREKLLDRVEGKVTEKQEIKSESSVSLEYGDDPRAEKPSPSAETEGVLPD